MNKLSQHLLEELSGLEEAIEQKAYDAVFTGISNAMKDLGFEGLGQVSTPETQPEPPKEKVPNGTMKVRARGRKGRSKPKSLTDTQKEVLASIQSYVDANGKSPTYTELSKDLDKSGVATIVHAIANKGWINLNDKKYSRKIEILHRM